MSAETLETGTVVERRILRLPEVETRIGFKRSHIYNLMHVGQFPKARRIGVRTVGWDSAEVDQWIAGRLGDPV
jgi:prophage regulatory protein